MRAANSFINYTITSVTSADAVFVSANVKLHKETQRTWRSTSLVQQVWVIDMGSTRTAPLPVLIYHANCPQIIIKANTTDSWVTPAYNSGTLTMVKDPEHQIYKHIQYITSNFRYIQITVLVQTPSDGAAYYEIGTILVPSAYKEFILSKEQFEWPVGREVTIYERDIEGETGIMDSVLLSKIPEIAFSLSGKMGIDFTTKDKLAAVFNQAGSGYVMMDFGLNPYEVYVVKRSLTYSSTWDRKISTLSYGFRTI